MNKILISSVLPMVALGFCSCASAKSKNKQTNRRYQSPDQHTAHYTAPLNRTEATREALHGKFVVTAVNGNTVVLRQMGSDQNQNNARIIVEYPAGLLIPQQGTVIERQEKVGFEVREVERSQDGQTNLYVRDLMVQ